MSPLLVAQKAPHTNAAKLFVYFNLKPSVRALSEKVWFKVIPIPVVARHRQPPWRKLACRCVPCPSTWLIRRGFKSCIMRRSL